MRNKLISSLVGAGFSFAASGAAFSADMAVKMPVKAPPPLPASIYSWTGFYVGGNVGYSWGRSSTNATLVDSLGGTNTQSQTLGEWSARWPPGRIQLAILDLGSGRRSRHSGNRPAR